jgi:predicted amidohydrolase YtcJ
MLPRKYHIVIENGKIVSCELSSYTQVIIDGNKLDITDAYILPSFVESHAHIIGQGEKLILPDIESCNSFDQLLQIAKSTSIRKGEWLFLRGWNEINWPSFPDSPIKALDEHFPVTPLALVRVDGHAMIVNSRAIETAKVDIKAELLGGEIKLDELGNPTGLIIDTAMEPFYDSIPEYDNQDIQKLISTSLIDYIDKGVTEIHDMDVYLRYLPIYSQMASDDRLPIRIRSFIRAFDDEYLKEYPKPFQIGNLNVCGLKFYADGALGSRGALMFEPYSDQDTLGLELISIDDLYRKAKTGCIAGWEIAVHAIGDKAVHNTLMAFRKLRDDGYENILRIEHSQIVKPEHIALFEKLNVIPSPQPIHCTSDSDMAVHRLGDRIDYAYPWKSFFVNGIPIIAGSDAPIESNSVIEGLNAFVNRKPKNPVTKWNYSEKISVEQALDSYILHPRYYVSEEYRNIRNTITPDEIIRERNTFILLDNNFDSTSPDSILGTTILATFAHGKIFHVS